MRCAVPLTETGYRIAEGGGVPSGRGQGEKLNFGHSKIDMSEGLLQTEI